MDCHHYSTESAERKKEQHLHMEDRGAIKVLQKQGFSLRAIALARAGMGKLRLIDFDRVDITNLHRQQYKTLQIGSCKAESLASDLQEISPYTKVEIVTEIGTEENFAVLLKGADIICEAFDRAEAKATAVSAVTYGIISCWMYVIGMGVAIFTGESDIAQIMVKAGLGVAGLLIIVFSTVTTTFLDAYSAGISSESLSAKISGKWVAVAVTVIGTLGAIFLPLGDITDYLYFIGSVFAPMIAIQIADFFILKRNQETKPFGVTNLIIWLVGFVVYRLLMRVDILVGNTLPDMLITIALCVVVGKIKKK